MGLERSQVREVVEVVNKAVADAVKSMGFVTDTCKVGYDSYLGTVTYKVMLISKATEDKAKNLYAVGNWKVGDVAKDRRGVSWTITGFSNRGSIKIANGNGKTYRCKLNYLLPKEA